MSTTILIADDEVIERKVLTKKLLRLFGEEIRILEAQNGREVLDLFASEHPAVMILDIAMPGITGLAAAEKIRETDSRCSIIFLTAFDEFTYAKKAIEVHALDYLLKPCDDKELADAVQEALRIARGVAAGREERTAGHLSGTPQTVTETDSEKSGQSSQQARMQQFIEEHFMQDLAVADIASAMGYSEAYFCKLFNQYFGKSFVSYLTDYRIREAKRLLASPAFSIGEIGNFVGYPDPNYFAKVFRRVTGKSPSDVRQELI